MTYYINESPQFIFVSMVFNWHTFAHHQRLPFHDLISSGCNQLMECHQTTTTRRGNGNEKWNLVKIWQIEMLGFCQYISTTDKKWGCGWTNVSPIWICVFLTWFILVANSAGSVPLPCCHVANKEAVADICCRDDWDCCYEIHYEYKYEHEKLILTW